MCPREEFPFQSITVECPICSELRVLVKFEVKTPYASARTMRKCPNEKASKSNSARRFLWTGSIFVAESFNPSFWRPNIESLVPFVHLFVGLFGVMWFIQAAAIYRQFRKQGS